MNQTVIITEFDLKPFGSKGWVRGKLFCPDCGRNDKFAVMFNDKGAVAHCFYCATAWPLWKILKDIGRTDLLDHDYEFSGKFELADLESIAAEEEEKEVKLPIGCIRINHDDYLADRGFLPWQYEQYGVSIAEIDARTENKLVFRIYQHGRLAGWIARTRMSKEWHKDNLRRYKENGDPLVLRYRNSENDFNKLLGGLDEITPETHTVILVEGLFDKANIDRLLALNDSPMVKCCFTFGDDLSVQQVDLIPPTVETVILMYDEGTVKQLKGAGEKLMNRFDVQVAMIEEKEVDPGNITAEKLSKLFLSMKSFLYFYSSLSLSKLS
jgi:hypothetical protein